MEERMDLVGLSSETLLELTNGLGPGEEGTPAMPIETAVGSGHSSPLVQYTRLSPNRTAPRRHKIDTISIHCMAGNLTVERCGQIFADPARKASSNYGIGSDGRIALYVEESDRSWCTSSAANDDRAVTIEVANTVAAEPWPVSDAALKALVELVADICRRNGIPRLLWQGDKSLIGKVEKQNMTVHRWFAAKACPGNYLYSRHGQIAQAVNEKLGVPEPVFTPYTVRVTAPVLNIRQGPGDNYPLAGTITDLGVYTITEEADGSGARRWGRLKSGMGWIALEFTHRV